MKIKINWRGREERFYGLNKLQLHSMNLDPSQMRERLAYWLFREMGVPAPRSVNARLFINGTFSGLYALTEEVDSRFTKYNFTDGDGNLYKEIWPVNIYGQAFPEQEYIKKLETNEENNPSAELIRAFGNDIAASTSSNIKDIVAKWIEVDKIMSFIAVDRTIRVDDGPFHWYCSGQWCGNHNYFWYEDPKAKKLHLIPWDMDNAFENIIANVNPVTPIADKWGETRANCQPFFGAAQRLQRSAA